MLFLLGVRIYRVPLYFLIYFLELFAGCFGLLCIQKWEKMLSLLLIHSNFFFVLSTKDFGNRILRILSKCTMQKHPNYTHEWFSMRLTVSRQKGNFLPSTVIKRRINTNCQTVSRYYKYFQTISAAHDRRLAHEDSFN